MNTIIHGRWCSNIKLSFSKSNDIYKHYAECIECAKSTVSIRLIIIIIIIITIISMSPP